VHPLVKRLVYEFYYWLSLFSWQGQTHAENKKADKNIKCVEKTRVVTEKIIRMAKGEMKHHCRNVGRGKMTSLLDHLSSRAGNYGVMQNGTMGKHSDDFLQVLLLCAMLRVFH